MDIRMGEGRRVPWGPIVAGAFVAAGIAWLGEVFGGALALGEGFGSGPWVGGVVSLALLVLGAGIGGFLASSLAGPEPRIAGAVEGLVVWGILASFGALTFSILGGNLALVAGQSPDDARISLAIATIGLVAAMAAAATGGLVGQERARGRPARRTVAAPRSEELGQQVRSDLEVPGLPGTLGAAPPDAREVPPPPVH